MILGILCILIGLAFLFPGLIEAVNYWGDPVGSSIGIVGIANSLLTILAGIAILRGWPRTRPLVIVTAGIGLVFTAIAGSLHFLGWPALLIGTGFPIALLVGYLRSEQKNHPTVS